MKIKNIRKYVSVHKDLYTYIYNVKKYFITLPLSGGSIDWLQSLKQFFINVSYHILVAGLTLMALF